MKLSALPLLFGALLLPAPVSAALEQIFLYLPDPVVVTTPASVGLEFEEVRFTASDGTRLHGWYLPGAADQPLVLFCHGNAGNISHRIDNLQLLHELGLTVFIFDYRGYGESAGQANEAGTYADMRGALNWLAGRGWTPQRMIYFGRSLGAAVALQLALETPPAGLVLEAPFTSLAAIGRHHYPLLWRLAGWALEARYDNLAKIAGLRAPLLIFHGEQDQIIPLRMGRELFAQATAAKRFYAIPRAGHNDGYAVGGADYWQQWQDFVHSIF